MQLLTSSDATSAELHILGDVSKGHWLFGKQETDTDASDVAQALIELPKSVGEITVHINSFGGEVAEGIAIYNALRSHPAKVTTVCEGFACSIASVIFMAGSKRVMRPASMLMLHNASMMAKGDPKALRKAAEDLDTITELSKTAYLEHATEALTPEMLTEIMDAETWVKPETAIEWGLATEIDEPEQSDEPSQSVARQIMECLCTTPGEFDAVVEGFDFEQLLEPIRRELAKLRDAIQKDDEDEDEEPEIEDPDTDTDEPDKGSPDTEDEDEKKQSLESSRLSQIFDQLAHYK
jgi:ATP-dependent protease ClpP protease subunit